MARSIGGEEFSRISGKEHNNQREGKAGDNHVKTFMGPKPSAKNPMTGNGINRAKRKSGMQ